MTVRITTIRPGLLVSMRTAIKGNVSNHTDVLKDDLKGRKQITVSQVTRTVLDKEEYERAVKVRTAVRTCITSVCIETNHGLLCPEDRVQRLMDGIESARELAKGFNDTAKCSTIQFSIIPGRIASNDVEAFRAINGEVRDLLRSMKTGIETLDVKSVRDAANKARKLGEMLTTDAQENIAKTVKAVRAEARKIAKAGELAAVEVNSEAMLALAKARTAFLDLDDVSDVEQPVAGADARAVDLVPENEPEVKRAIKRVRAQQPAELEL